jgi:hypothetical protein
MPTNNQEKWWKKRFTIQPTKIDDLCLDSVEAFDAVDNGKPVESFLREELESFIRQEIRQAKIEGMREIMTIVREHKTEVGQWVIQDLLEKIKQAISNLKNNDNTTKN